MCVTCEEPRGDYTQINTNLCVPKGPGEYIDAGKNRMVTTVKISK